MHFVTTTELQKRASEIATRKEPSLILQRGKPKSIVIPFFTGYEEFLDEYMEAYEIDLNKEKIIKDLQDSRDSGMSSFTI